MIKSKMYLDSFTDIIKKATLNLLIDNISVKVYDNKILSKMKSTENTVVIIDKQNNLLSNVPSEIILNFSNPNLLMQYLSLISNNEIDVKISDNKITMIDGEQKINLFFCSERRVSEFTLNDVESKIQPQYERKIDDDFLNILSNIKKIAVRFNKVYFTLENNILSVETTDKTNRSSNSLKIKIDDINNNEDFTILFSFKDFFNIISLIDNENYTFKITHVGDNLGMISIIKNDNTEKYYLMSKEEFL